MISLDALLSRFPVGSSVNCTPIPLCLENRGFNLIHTCVLCPYFFTNKKRERSVLPTNCLSVIIYHVPFFFKFSLSLITLLKNYQFLYISPISKLKYISYYLFCALWQIVCLPKHLSFHFFYDKERQCRKTDSACSSALAMCLFYLITIIRLSKQRTLRLPELLHHLRS